MLEHLFKFPIVMIDGDNEERKTRQNDILSSDDEIEYDIIIGEAEYPYTDIIGLEDKWLPSKDSFDKARDGKFEACVVRFANVGFLLVPWTKKKFKEQLAKFAETYEKTNQKQVGTIKVKHISLEEAKKLLGDGKGE